jgi:hypothetical protein
VKRVIVTLFLAVSLNAQTTPVTNPGAFERILVPLLTPPARGNFGAVFITRLSVWNKHEHDRLELFGLEQFCPIETCTSDPLAPLRVEPFTDAALGDEAAANGKPGRFFYVLKERASDVAANLRVFDQSRDTTNFGTEIPVVREREFVTRIILPNVPVSSPRFRNTLRIYSDRATSVTVTFIAPEIIGSPVIGPQPQTTVTLAPGGNLFEPAYAVFTNFQPYRYDEMVLIESNDPGAKIWAFVSVTNNDTQHITTITPQP